MASSPSSADFRKRARAELEKVIAGIDQESYRVDVADAGHDAVTVVARSLKDPTKRGSEYRLELASGGLRIKITQTAPRGYTVKELEEQWAEQTFRRVVVNGLMECD